MAHYLVVTYGALAYEQLRKLLLPMAHFQPKPLTIAECLKFYRQTQWEEESATEGAEGTIDVLQVWKLLKWYIKRPPHLPTL